GAAFASHHGVVTAVKPAATDDITRLESRQSCIERGYPGQMRAIRASRVDVLGLTLDEKRNAAILDSWRDGPHLLDRARLAAGEWACEHRRHISGIKCLGELGYQSRVVERRRDQIKTRRRSPMSRGRSSSSRHPANLSAGLRYLRSPAAVTSAG